MPEINLARTRGSPPSSAVKLPDAQNPQTFKWGWCYCNHKEEMPFYDAAAYADLDSENSVSSIEAELNELQATDNLGTAITSVNDSQQTGM